jgi:hypothetical protein
MQSIIVVTYKGSPWIGECLDSLAGCKYPVHVCINPPGKSAYDPAGFYYAKEHGLEQFIIMHDTMIIKDMSFFDDAFAIEGNVSFPAVDFLMCFGKYDASLLPPLPAKPTKKMEAIMFETYYARKIPKSATLFPDFDDTHIFVHKHGKDRMVLENDYVIKYKATWHPDMVSPFE